jgi:hypothetical protein
MDNVELFSHKKDGFNLKLNNFGGEMEIVVENCLTSSSRKVKVV